MPNGRSVDPTVPPPGLSALPLAIVTCGWNGTLPPSSVESFSVTRLWKMPPLARTTVFSLTDHEMPRRGSKALECVSEKPRGSPRNSARTAGLLASAESAASPSKPSPGSTTPL